MSVLCQVYNPGLKPLYERKSPRCVPIGRARFFSWKTKLTIGKQGAGYSRNAPRNKAVSPDGRTRITYCLTSVNRDIRNMYCMLQHV